MKYEGVVYRPPSEAYSMIIQITIGCAHNQCTFCGMYKEKTFRVRSIEEIKQDLEAGRKTYKQAKRIFLADGNGLAVDTPQLEAILLAIKSIFPECERVGIYGGPKDILRKTTVELQRLRELGLGIVYLGVESGSDIILKKIRKGITADEMIEAGKRIVASGIKLSATLISGLGGRDMWQEHAEASALVMNQINPHYLGLLTLMVQPGTEMYQAVQEKRMELLSPKEVMLETRYLIENLQLSRCVFRSNHASNYVALDGILSQDKNRLLEKIDDVLQGENAYKEEFYRRL